MSTTLDLDHPVLRNKITPPRIRPNRIVRDRLIQLVEGSVWSKLTLFCAPAGYGKTSVINDWAHTTQRTVCWLQLDEEDNLLHHFFQGLVFSIRSKFPEFAISISSVLNHNQLPAPDQLAHLLLHEIEALPGSFILVMDDYHQIHELDIHRLMKELLEHLPENMHLLMATREDPPFPLASMRAKDELQEVRMRELQFSADEIQSWMNDLLNYQLEPGQIQTLVEKTEGWAAGIHLAALSLRENTNKSQFLHEFTGSNRFILDFLIEEVLNHLDESVRAFLLRLSILDQFNSPLTSFLMPGATNLPQLADLEADNLFLSAIDAERNWFRLHPLFSDLLRMRLKEEVGQDGVKNLLLLAADWEKQNGLYPESVQHYVQAGEPGKAGEVAVVYSSLLLERGESARCTAWLEHLPVEVTQNSLGIQLLYGYAFISNSQFVEAGKHAGMAQALFDSIQQYLPEPQIIEMQSRINCIKALVAAEMGEIEEARRLSDFALPQLSINDPVRTSLWIGMASGYQHNDQIQEAIRCLEKAAEECTIPEQNGIRLVALNNLAMIYIQMGEFELGDKISLASMYKSDRITPEKDPIVSIAYLYQSILAYEKNNLARAEEFSRIGLEYARIWGNLDMLCSLSNVRILYALANQQADLAEEAFNQYCELARNFHPAQFSYDLFLGNALRYYLSTNQTGKARKLIQESFLDLARVTDFRAENLWIEKAIAELWLDRHLDENTRNKIVEIRERCKAGGRVVTSLQLSLLLLTDEFQHNSVLEDRTELDGAMKECQELRLFRSLADLLPIYQPIFELSLKSSESSIRNYAKLLLEQYDKRVETTAQVSDAAIQDPLSDRELEVIHLLAAGLSNTVIAERLFISPGTVKRHLHNIFDKLGATSRLDAVTQARKLGLIP